MAKKGKKAASPEREYDIFDALGLNEEPEGAGETREGDNDGENGAGDPSLEALQARIDALQRDLERSQRTNTALMAQFQAPAGGSAPVRPQEQQLPALPDPTVDPEGYQKELARRISGDLEAKFAREAQEREAQIAQQRTQQERLEALWGEFEEKHPDLAAHQDLVAVAASAVTQRARVKGLDPQKYMFGASEQYIEDVAAEVNRRFGKALKVMKEEEEAEDGAGNREEGHSTIAEAIAAARTAGISGGATGGSGAPARAPGGDEGGGDDLISDLHKMQRKMGIR